jgi:HdeA/HdeB family
VDIEIGATRIARCRAIFGGLGDNMNRLLLVATVTAITTLSAAKADPVPLSTYADANGFIDVQTLTCGQLANTYQEDANALTSWYSGWYNGLAHKHFADFKKGREVEHQVIEYCKAHPEQKIIHAVGLMIKEDRAEGMMREK